MTIVSADQIARAVAALRGGELVAFPTETVYGLGADAANETAVRRIFAAKGRPADHPLIVHLPGVDALTDWARDVPPAARRLAERFWPGPLTMILPKAPHVPDVVTGRQPSIGLRIPDHPVALALLAAFGGGIAAPSANRFGRISPTRAEHVQAELGDAVALILDGGPCRVGVESSIVDLTGEQPVLLRPGQISATQIAEVVGVPLAQAHKSTTRAPGTLPSHYAPVTRTMIIGTNELAPTVNDLLDERLRIAVLARHSAPIDHPGVTWRVAPSDADGYAHALYAHLRELDALRRDRIVVEAVPEGEAWLAIRDRLQRAASQEPGTES
ncbi:MAG TPA: L-threonylcarbamoyladenylate synthase [Herpetosiphonaceae bacterium]